MIKQRMALLGVLLLTPGALLAAPLAPTKDAELAAVVGGNNRFALELYRQLSRQRQNTGKDLFLSPFSIATALAMTYGGARGKTAAQMAKALHFPLPTKRLHAAYQELLAATSASAGKNNELRLANALWVQRGYPLHDSYLALVQKRYDAVLQGLDFIKETETARQTINRWAKKRTKGKIVDLLAKGALTALTRLVLSNAIYFKGNWAQPFAAKLTRQLPFTLQSGAQIKTPLMQQTSSWRYLKRGDLQLLELPYQDERLALVVLLPQRANGLPALERQLTARQLNKLLAGAHEQRVRVLLPRFKTTSSFKLASTLQILGMKLAFSGAADLSGISPQQDLQLSEVFHKAFVQVNEKGTEAAAVTAVGVRRRGRPAPPPEFRADRPFFFLIRDRISGAILFVGRLLDPRE